MAERADGRLLIEVALRNGVKGVLLKHSAPELLAKTIRKVSRGEVCFNRALTNHMLRTWVQRKSVGPPPEKAGISSLTKRENQVISRICEGIRNKENTSKLTH
jgi:DNA-binding NarL/FixJ family response regulator